jgi:F-type H+-transporting ATPase subunit gamma
MAGSMRDIQAKINATKKTSQITKAMHMVSASKLRRAEKKIKEYRPFLQSVKNTIADIMTSNIDVSHKMLIKREVKKTAYILVTSDRGLNGGYNSNVYRQFFNNVKRKHKSENEYIVGVLGQKGFNYFKNKDINLVNKTVLNVRDDVQFVDIISLIQQVIDYYILEEIDEVIIYYNKFINTITQEVVAEKILPLEKVEGETKQGASTLYEFDPTPQDVLDTLLPIYIQNVIYGFILNAKVSEHAATMNAMSNATNNAKELIDKLSLHYNRARQASITQEITEIVGGAAALS